MWKCEKMSNKKKTTHEYLKLKNYIPSCNLDITLLINIKISL